MVILKAVRPVVSAVCQRLDSAKLQGVGAVSISRRPVAGQVVCRVKGVEGRGVGQAEVVVAGLVLQELGVAVHGGSAEAVALAEVFQGGRIHREPVRVVVAAGGQEASVEVIAAAVVHVGRGG